MGQAFCDPMQTLPMFSFHEIFQAKIAEWVAIYYSKPRITLGKLEKPVTLPYSAAGKESACNAGDPVDSWVGKICQSRDRLLTPVFLGFPGGSDSKEFSRNVGEQGWEDLLEKGKATHSSILA